MIKVNHKEVQFEQFPNGETKIVEDYLKSLVGMNVIIDFKYVNDSDLIKLMFVKNYLDDLNVEVIELRIMYMPYSRMDRSENYSPFTLKYISKFINSLGFKNIEVIEPHSDVTVALLDNSYANYINYDLIEEVVEMVNFDRFCDYLIFPDGGSQKRYSKMTKFNILVGNKTRNFQTGRIEGLDIIGYYNKVGTKAIIVDDLSSYGGTFVKTSEALKKLGFKEIYLLVAHAENSVFKGELFNHIDKLFTTDSIISEQNYWNNLRFKDKLHIFNI